jgi:hypothetical protein
VHRLVLNWFAIPWSWMLRAHIAKLPGIPLRFHGFTNVPNWRD